jgi:2-oxoglutarate ferredoxin oxidoreductase subunit delta
MNNGKGISISIKNRIYLNLLNLVFFLIVAFTGSVIQTQYHMHGLPEAYSVMGFGKAEWALLHKASAVVFFAGLVVHCLVNWGFVATSTKRIFNGKISPLLSHSYVLFLISAPACLTAMASWILFGGEERARFALVETHDKLGWLLVIFGLIHLISRSGRMINIFRKAREKAMIGKNRTEYIHFDSGKCKACWKCIEVCPEDVFGKINLLIHKHVKIVSRDHCIGCLKCIKACSHRAINPIIAKKEVVGS